MTAFSFRNRRVLVTGHTGFKGSWLCEWLIGLGAEVTGFARPPCTDPALFDQLGLAGRMDHRIGDICDLGQVEELVQATRPEFVFHLAAQPLVRHSYREPVETFMVNTMGSVHLLEALRRHEFEHPVVAVMVTTDKCYENREWLHGYREEDPMGGFDPYSASKGMAELAIAAMRSSFAFATDTKLRIASARAGNVIGGGDWADDRIVPDCIRALKTGDAIPVRNRVATRPWQHVLEPLGGYLGLAGALAAPDWRNAATAFNFGPPLASNRTVEELVREILVHWPGDWVDAVEPGAVHEAGKLNLATDKAFHLLGWQPRWNFEMTIARTVEWYRDPDPVAATRRQIAEYTGAAITA